MKIEKGIEIPKRKTAHRRVYDFHLMDVGDSFLLDKKKASSMYACLRSYNKTLEKRIKITTRSVEGGLRVWRIK